MSHQISSSANAPRIPSDPDLRQNGFAVRSEKFVSIPQLPVEVNDLTIAKQVMKLHDSLDGYQDTLNVFTNFEVADELVELLD